MRNNATASPTLRDRLQRCHATHPADGLRLRSGTLADYAALAEHHYRARKPATATRVLVLEDPRPGLGERFRALADEARTHDIKPRDGRRPTQVVGVLVESLPSLSCRMRDWALHERYDGHLDPGPRAQLLNDELRCISRVVIDPRWRGLGLAVRLVRAALREPTTVFTEALAAMGRVNPFFERAGMTAYPRPAHGHDARFAAALVRVGLNPRDLTVIDHTWSLIQALPTTERRWLFAELHRWYRLNAGRSAIHETEPRAQLLVARQRLQLEPVYYLKDHRQVSAPDHVPVESA